MLIQKFEPSLRLGTVRNIVILQDADRAIHLQHSQGRLGRAGNAMLPQGPVEFVHGDMFFCHMRRNALAIVDQERRRSLDQLTKAPVYPGKLRQQENSV